MCKTKLKIRICESIVWVVKIPLKTRLKTPQTILEEIPKQKLFRILNKITLESSRCARMPADEVCWHSRALLLLYGADREMCNFNQAHCQVWKFRQDWIDIEGAVQDTKIRSVSYYREHESSRRCIKSGTVCKLGWYSLTSLFCNCSKKYLSIYNMYEIR